MDDKLRKHFETNRINYDISLKRAQKDEQFKEELSTLKLQQENLNTALDALSQKLSRWPEDKNEVERVSFQMDVDKYKSLIKEADDNVLLTKQKEKEYEKFRENYAGKGSKETTMADPQDTFDILRHGEQGFASGLRSHRYYTLDGKISGNESSNTTPNRTEASTGKSRIDNIFENAKTKGKIAEIGKELKNNNVSLDKDRKGPER